MTDWPPTGGTPPTGATGRGPPTRGSASPGNTSPAWAVTPTGSTPASPGGVSPPSKKKPFGSGLPREGRLAITVLAVLLVIGLVIGLIFWSTSSSDDPETVPPVVSSTTTAAPTTTVAAQPAVSVPPPPPPPPTAAAAPSTTTDTTEAPGGYDPDALGPAVPPDVAGFPSQQAWAAMRECQTGGDYTKVSEEGTNYGAYQFRPETWDELAGSEYPSLVGVLPSEASPADQDRMAYALWQEFGSSRWPGCRHTIDPSPPPTTAAPATQQADAAPPTTAAQAETDPPATQTGSPPTLPRIDLSTLPGPTTTTTTTTVAASGLPTAAQWEQLRQCESNGDYTVRSANGLYYGAYQFNILTWDDIARKHAPLLVGVLPSEASPREQDFLAQKLWDERGRRPWPVCGARHLPENPNR